MQSVENKILTKIRRTPKGVLLFPEAIRLALHRLVNKKEVIRVAQGIYARLKVSELIGEVLPSAEEVAEAIAKRDRIRTIPTGAYALNALGLVPRFP